MAKIRNIAFITIACAMTFCCIGNMVLANLLGVTDIPEHSSLEGRTYQKLPEASAESLSNGTFQSEFEQYVADSIPRRDSVLLANARIQQSLIRTASVPSGYQVFPTFFGSNYYCTADGKRVIESPGKLSHYSAKRFKNATDAYNKLFTYAKHTNWVVYMPDRGASSLGSPLHGQFSDAIDYNDLKTGFLDHLEGAKVLDGSIETTDKFFEMRYSTDHHWNIAGAVDGYEAIMSALGRKTIEFSEIKRVYRGEFFGSASRNGLFAPKAGDVIEDAVYEPSTISIQINGKNKKLKDVNKAWGSKEGRTYKKDSKFANVYAEFFHTDYAKLHYHNDAGTGSLLIIGDSFTDCMDRFFAESYKDVWVLDLRHYKKSLRKFLDKNDFDDAIILMGCTNIMEDQVVSRLNQ